MRIFRRQPPWYAAGLCFECTQCGRCCAGPEEGYVWATPEELAAIADHLGITEKQLRKKYVRKVRGRFSLREVPGNRDCVFLQPLPDGARRCAVYPVRPTQCRTWPFWPHNLRSPEAWALTQLRCKGINQGPRHELEEIERKRQANRE
jgi:hypothetical protein